MNKQEQEIEQEIQQKGLNAPRITPDHIEEQIMVTHFWSVPDSTTIVCAIQLKNGFVVTGESACASVENFNEELGQKIAYNNAREKIWMLEGYLLKQKLSEEQK